MMTFRCTFVDDSWVDVAGLNERTPLLGASAVVNSVNFQLVLKTHMRGPDQLDITIELFLSPMEASFGPQG